MTIKASKLDRLPQITQTLDAELRDTTPTFQEHYQRLHVGLREWWREYTNISNAQDQADTQNLLINGGFQVWQRTAGNAVASSASTELFTADRWAFYRDNTGAFVTGASAARSTALTPDAPYSLSFYRDSGQTTTYEVRVYQSVPSSLAERVRGKHLALRFNYGVIDQLYLTSGSMRVRIITGTGTDQTYAGGGYTSATTILDETISDLLDISGSEAGVFTATTSAVVASTVSEITVLFSYAGSGTATGSDGVKIGNVQLVPFNDAVVYTGEFKWRSFEDELAACLPYYEKSFPYTTAPAQNAGVTAALYWSQVLGASTLQNASTMVRFTVRKRATPVVTLYNPSAANAQIRNSAAPGDWSGSTDAVTSEAGFLPQGTSPAGTAAGQSAIVHWTADAEI